MTTLEIEGIGEVEVDDAFLSLSPEDQAIEVDAIAKSVGGQSAQPTQAGAGATPEDPDELIGRGEFLPIGKTRGGEFVPALPAFLEGPRQTIVDLMSGTRTAEEITGEEVLGLGAVFAGGGAASRIGVKSIIKPKKPTILGKAGEKLEAKAAEQVAKKRTDFLDDLVSPKLTAQVKAERAARTGDPTLLKAGKVEPTAGEAAVAEAVGDVPGVLPKNTIFKNLKAVNRGIATEGERLERALAAQPNKIPREAMIAERKALEKRLAENPLLVGDAAKVAKKVGAKAEELIKEHGATGVGMLRARRELDVFVKKQSPKGVFDPARESALTVAVKEVRQSMNSLIEKSSASVKVKESLSTQANLFRGAENISAKAADQAGSKIEQLRKRVSKALGVKEVAGASIAVVGIGAAVAAKALAAGFIAVQAGKLIMSPTAKRGVAKLLQQSEKAIRKTTDPATISVLRADRSAVIDLLKRIE